MVWKLILLTCLTSVTVFVVVIHHVIYNYSTPRYHDIMQYYSIGQRMISLLLFKTKQQYSLPCLQRLVSISMTCQVLMEPISQKNRLQPRCYYRMRIGQSVKFGGSSRIFVLDVRINECTTYYIHVTIIVVHMYMYMSLHDLGSMLSCKDVTEVVCHALYFGIMSVLFFFSIWCITYQ